jgi:hypothetical protein
MTEQKEAYFRAEGVGNVDGPVGMDLGIWLHFDTDQGKLRLKLSHEDAIDLYEKLRKEPSVAASPKTLVANAADSLIELAADLDSGSTRREETTIAETLKGHATNLQTAVSKMSGDD